MFRTAAIILLSVSLSGVSAFAADRNGADAAARSGATTTTGADAPLAGDVDWSLPPVQFGPAKRPAALPMLYASLAALQIYDAASTLRGVPNGARETNPLMRGVVGSPAKFFVLKAATTAVPMMIAERMWHRNRVGAIVVMALANGVLAAVAANNARVLHTIR